MSVNSNGISIYAHASLTIDDIISIIMTDDNLKSKARHSIYDIESLRERLHRPGILVRTQGKSKEAIYERSHRPISCECGCTVHRNTISKDRKAMQHKTMLEEALV